MLPKLFQELVKNLTRFINLWKNMEKPPKSYPLYHSGLASLTTQQACFLLMLHVHHGLLGTVFQGSCSKTWTSTWKRDRDSGESCVSTQVIFTGNDTLLLPPTNWPMLARVHLIQGAGSSTSMCLDTGETENQWAALITTLKKGLSSHQEHF